MQHFAHTRIGTRTVFLSFFHLFAVALIGAVGLAAPARAAEPPPPQSESPTAAMAAAATEATAEAAASRQWVWLYRQGLWGFGYQRGDGLWVIDAGTKQAETPVVPATETSFAKQWVWLYRQGLWGFGYQRGDGLWVIDTGTKQAETPAAAVTAAAPAAAPAQAVAAAPAATGDPYGFVNWLNATRASFGLAPVGVDPSLSQWAAANNAQQAARGMGHHVMGSARRQNAAAGGDASSVGPMWMASPAHRAALLDPTIRWIGIAGLGAYWTFNAN